MFPANVTVAFHPFLQTPAQAHGSDLTLLHERQTSNVQTGQSRFHHDLHQPAAPPPKKKKKPFANESQPALAASLVQIWCLEKHVDLKFHLHHQHPVVGGGMGGGTTRT